MYLNAILDVGLILLAAALGSSLIKFIDLPRITSYIIIGVIIGPSLLNLVSPGLMENSDIFTNIALSFIAFDLGKKFSAGKMRSMGKSIFCIASVQAIVTLSLVALSIYFLMERSIAISMVYGAIACATAPAATILVAREERAEGSFTDTLLGVVALDDGLGIILFAVFLSAAKAIAGIGSGGESRIVSGMLQGSREIFCALGLGFVLGYLLSHLPRIVKRSSDLMIYTLGMILFNAGLSIHFGFSVLLAALTMGVTVENCSSSDVKFFGAVEKVESPFYVLFFVLAGAHLEVGMITGISMLGLVYLIFRFAGKMGGGWLGARISGAGREARRWIGLALMPQAGVALGFALIVKADFAGNSGREVFFVVLATTVFFEILGPVFTKIALERAGETGT